MTGAQLPEGTDAVVMFEQTVQQEDTFSIRKTFEQHENVSLKGEETQTGDIVLKAGQQINPGAIAVLATYGYTDIEVWKKPSIAVIATGSELLEVEDELQPGKIRNSNGPMIKALAEKFGLKVGTYQIQQDDLQSSIEVVKKRWMNMTLLLLQVAYLSEILTTYLKFIKHYMQKYYLIKLQ